MSAAQLYERIRAACCPETGLSKAEYETHVRMIALLVLQVKGELK